MKTIEINTAKHIQDYKILLEFNDNLTKVIDFKELLYTTPYPNEKKYVNPSLFIQFKVEMGDLIWNDYDMCFQAQNLYHGIFRK